MKITISSVTIFITVLICILKLIGILNISWFWCFSLVWLPFAILLVLITLISIITAIYAIFYVIFENIKE